MPDWPHSPVHRFSESGVYIVTAGTYQKKHLFKSPESLDMFCGMLFTLCKDYGWELRSWAVMINHYHFIAATTGDPSTLKEMITKLHRHSAIQINKLDNNPGRKVWFQYWDSRITFEKSYYARLRYVNNNPVHHGIVKDADEYKWCSALWFRINADPAMRKTLESFKTDKLNLFDDF